MDHGPHRSKGEESTIGLPGSETQQLDEAVAGEKREEGFNAAETGLERVLSRIASRSSYPDPGPPPDGGLQAWTQSLMGHLVVFNTWGYIISFGVFQQYLTTTLDRSPSDISWVGSVQIFLLFFVGTASGRAVDYGLFRVTFILGSLFLLVGVFATSWCTRYLPQPHLYSCVVQTSITISSSGGLGIRSCDGRSNRMPSQCTRCALSTA